MNCYWEENLSMSQHLFILSEQTEYPSLREWLGERRAGSGTGTEVWDCPVPSVGQEWFCLAQVPERQNPNSLLFVTVLNSLQSGKKTSLCKIIISGREKSLLAIFSKLRTAFFSFVCSGL